MKYQGIAHTYIGYDLNNNDNDNPNDSDSVKDDNCYFKYSQASSASSPPKYEIVDSGC